MNDAENFFNNCLYVQNKLMQADMNMNQQIEVFKSVFEEDQNQVMLLISALNYIGYFYPAPAPLYDPAIVASNPELNNSINFYLNQSTVDLAQYMFSQLSLYQGYLVVYSCYVQNKGQWVNKYLSLTNEFHSDLHKLLNKMESAQKNGETEHLFWDDEKFSELVNAIELIKPNVSLKIPDYTAVLIKTNFIEQIYEMQDRQVKPVFDNCSVTSRLLFPAGDSYTKPVFAQMIIGPTMEKLEANTDNVIKHLFYYTAGDKNTFDKLAKDFIHLAMRPIF